MIEEIEREAPNTRDPPPRLLQTFMCHGDTIEVVEDKEASEQVKELRVALALVSGRIEVSLHDQLKLEIMPVNYVCRRS